jgi:hypothetical protein
MKYRARIFFAAIVILCSNRLIAQNETDFSSKINSNLGFVIGVPTGTTSDIVSTGWGVNTGIGDNFNNRNAFIPEFTWSRVYANTSQLQPLVLALAQGAGGLNGTTDLFITSANYRFELRGRALGAYLIGGGGWYHRHSDLSRTVTSGTATTCTPVWLWWGFTCTSGTVTTNQTIASASTSGFGPNIGVGFTVRVGEEPYRLYVESRYHYVFDLNSNSLNSHPQFVLVTFGIRY